MPRTGTIKGSFYSVRFKLMRFGFIFRFNSISQRSVLKDTPLLKDKKTKNHKNMFKLWWSSFPLTDMNQTCSNTLERLLGCHFCLYTSSILWNAILIGAAKRQESIAVHRTYQYIAQRSYREHVRNLASQVCIQVTFIQGDYITLHMLLRHK